MSVNLNGYTLVVTGFPRSGTSMMMRMLMLGGVHVMADSQFRMPLHKHDPYGCLELEGIGKSLKAHSKRWTKNRALKIVAPYASWYPVDRPLKAIFMQRDLTEIVTSLLAMRNAWDVDIAESIEWARGYLAYNEIPTLFVRYKDAIQYPRTTALRIQDFLETELDIDKMASGADPNARTKYKRDPSLLGHDKEDHIISMNAADYGEIKVDNYTAL